ncbi:hypothetical protein F3N42_11165 [Marinihelvus fidelis]|uniref:Uncharacterized protein n=1 Tax=Marinihelvus fidelis TaxID=2613842 RepID=A0A5N0T7H8_9GAMM|nr:hypothetical protein [Marinihelvus fidelis]KAA9130910.1 hypothetical protein F3N42_11165 [Marinihelvus fidelis]
MSEPVNIPTWPVVGWNLAQAESAALLLLNVRFLSSREQSVDVPSDSGYYVMTRQQAQDLSKMLADYAAKLPEDG